jgi:hypothetical protein
MSDSTAVTVGTGVLPAMDVEGGGAHGLVPNDPTMVFLQTIEARVELAKMLVASRLIPQTTPEAAMAVMLQAHEMGIPPMAGFRNIHAIPDKDTGGMRLTTSADLACALASGRYGVSYDVAEWSTKVCRLVFHRPGRADVVSEFTIEEARTAGLAGKKNWTAWPRAMLSARAKFQGVRMICPEVGAGLYDADELGVETDAEGIPIPTATWTYAPSEGASAASPPPTRSAPAAGTGGAVVYPVPACPKCGGPMFDNTERCEQRAATGQKPGPQYKCRKRGPDKECEGLYWVGQWPGRECVDLAERINEYDPAAGKAAKDALVRIFGAPGSPSTATALKVTQLRDRLAEKDTELAAAAMAAEQEEGEGASGPGEPPADPYDGYEAPPMEEEGDDLDELFGRE